MDNCQNCSHDHDADVKKPEGVVEEVSVETPTLSPASAEVASEGAQTPTEEVSETVSE